MADSKKSFIMHKDSLSILDKLSDEQAGRLFKAIKSFQCGEDYTLDEITDLVFTPFKSCFERDCEKYEAIVNKNRINGLKGGRPKSQNNPNKPSGFSGNPNKPKKADSDSDSDSDSDKERSMSDKSDSTKFSDEDLRLAKWIFAGVKNVAPKTKEPNLGKWAEVVRLMRERDGLTHREIADVFKWANHDSFWSLNILSPSKLRDKYSELHAKMSKTPAIQQQQPIKKPRAFGQ